MGDGGSRKASSQAHQHQNSRVKSGYCCVFNCGWEAARSACIKRLACNQCSTKQNAAGTMCCTFQGCRTSAIIISSYGTGYGCYLFPHSHLDSISPSLMLECLKRQAAKPAIKHCRQLSLARRPMAPAAISRQGPKSAQVRSST